MYKIIGADGRQYGPVSAGQIKQWIAEGRVESRTPVFTAGAADWNFIGLLPEFANCFLATTPQVITPSGQPPKTNSYATAGLVCSILAWICCCGFPFNLLGLVFSLTALSQIRRHPEVYEGRGLAIAGLILSIVSLLLTFGAAIWSLAFNPPAFQWNFKSF
jgi:hypothetical protein